MKIGMDRVSEVYVKGQCKPEETVLSLLTEILEVSQTCSSIADSILSDISGSSECSSIKSEMALTSVMQYLSEILDVLHGVKHTSQRTQYILK